MRIAPRAIFGVASTLIALAGPLSTARADGTPDTWNWQLVSAGFSPDGGDIRSSLPSLFAASTSDVYLTGCYRCLFRWNGTTFSSQTQPAGANRYTVSGAPGSAIYSAGQQGYQSGNLLRFDGTTWTNVLTTPGELINTYVAPDGGVFAVGDGTFYRNTGSGFTSVSTGLSTAFNTDRLGAITGFGSNDVFMGGYNGRILRYDGTGITSMTTGVNAAFVAMDGTSANSLYAVGSNGTVMFFNGSTWSQLPTITTGTLLGVKALGPNDVLVSGENGFFARWNGVSWTTIDLGTTNRLGSISTPDAGKTLFVAEATYSDVRFRLGSAVYAPTTVPEPGTTALVALGLAGVAVARGRRRGGVSSV